MIYNEEKLVQLGLLKLCEILHMSLTGASSPLSNEDELIIRSHLQKSLNEWVDRNEIYSYYDRAVKQLIQITLIEKEVIDSKIDLREKSLDQIINLHFYL